MYDIEVIDGKSYAIITEDGLAYNFLKAMNTKLLMKKLCSQPGDQLFLTSREVALLCKGFAVKDLKRLTDIGLIEQKSYWLGDDVMYLERVVGYTFTDYGLEIAKDLKDHGGDIEIRL